MPRLFRAYTLRAILIASFALAVVRFLVIGWLAQSLVALLVAQVLHAATFGAFHAASIGYVHKFFRGRLQSRGQAIYGSVSFGVGGAIGGFASGYAWDLWGAAPTFTLGAACALAGMLDPPLEAQACEAYAHRREPCSGRRRRAIISCFIDLPRTSHDLHDSQTPARSTTSCGTATSCAPEQDGTGLLYIDRHLVHEVTSPQAYEGLEVAGRKPWRVDSVVATADHNTPTKDWDKGITDPVSRLQVETLDENMKKYGAKVYFPFLDRRQGIVHVIGPEQGATLPGMTVVCGDSHTSTHGAFGALAFGIGTSEVEHVLATQCMVMQKSKTMQVVVEGKLPEGVTAKDITLAVIGKIGSGGGTGYAIEYAGSAIRDLEHGRPHDPVQHGDRSRRAHRARRGRREDDRVRRRPRRSRPRASCGTRRSRTGARSRATRARSSTRSSRSRRKRSSRR